MHSIEVIQKELHEMISKEAKDDALPYLKKKRYTKRHILFRILSGSCFFEPQFKSLEYIYNIATTCDIILIRTVESVIGVNVELVPDVVLGYIYT